MAGAYDAAAARYAGAHQREKRNVLGLMPHPERVVDPLTGGSDGRALFQSLIEATVAAVVDATG